MNASPHEDPLPIYETVTDKTDVIDWSLVKDEPYDLEYRDQFDLTPLEAAAVIGPPLVQLSLAGLAMWAIAYIAANWFAPPVSPTLLGVLAGFAVVVGIARAAWTVRTDDGLGPDLADSLFTPAVLSRAVAPLLLWLAIACTGWLHLLAGAFSYYLLVSLPVAVLVFDQFATHAVYWNTASPAADHTAKRLGRAVWQCRLLGLLTPFQSATYRRQDDADPDVVAIIDATRTYAWGPAWLAAATLLPTLLLILTLDKAKPELAGLAVLSAMTLGLLVAAILRSGGDARVVPRFFRMIFLWFQYGCGEVLPPWLFRSPCGEPSRRRAIIMLAVGLLTVPLTSLAAHSFTAMAEAVPLTPGADGSPSWLWITPASLVALLIAPLHFCLVGILLTGRVLVAYHDAFEQPLPPPPTPAFPDEDEQPPEDQTEPQQHLPQTPALNPTAETAVA